MDDGRTIVDAISDCNGIETMRVEIIGYNGIINEIQWKCEKYVATCHNLLFVLQFITNGAATDSQWLTHAVDVNVEVRTHSANRSIWEQCDNNPFYINLMCNVHRPRSQSNRNWNSACDESTRCRRHKLIIANICSAADSNSITHRISTAANFTIFAVKIDLTTAQALTRKIIVIEYILLSPSACPRVQCPRLLGVSSQFATSHIIIQRSISDVCLFGLDGWDWVLCLKREIYKRKCMFECLYGENLLYGPGPRQTRVNVDVSHLFSLYSMRNSPTQIYLFFLLLFLTSVLFVLRD